MDTPVTSSETAASAHDQSRSTPHHSVNYPVIFVTLIALTAVTVVMAAVRFNNELVNVLLALLIASVKAMFVAVYFMHLKFEGKLIYLILFIPISLCLCLIAALVPDFVHGTLFTPLLYPPAGAHGVMP